MTVSAGQDDDAAADAAVTLSHAVSGAVEYAAISAGDIPSVTVTIDEDDAAGVSVDPTALNVVEGQSNAYTVVLDTQPSAEVTVTISGHTGSDLNLSAETLTFTSGNWNQAQTVRVSADQDADAAADPAVTLTHAASGAGEYAAISAGDIPSVTVTIDEDDEAGVSVNPSTLTVPEGGDNSYTVVLDTQPSADVTVTISGHSGSDLNLSAETLTFTPDNWNVAQTVTVSAAQDEDAAADPTVTLSHAVNGTGEYAAVSAEDIPSVTVTIDEDDEAGVSVNPTALTVVEGSTASYTVVLDTQPSAEVTVTISGHTGSDLNLSAETLTFTSVNWNQAQTVRVSADQDADAAADPAVTLSHAVSGAVEYAAVSAEDIPGVTVAIEEDDAAGVSVDPTALTVVEGSTASYTVVLDTQPSAEVTVAVSGHDGTDVSVTPSTLTFTSGNWNQAQTVTVSADQDDDAAADPAVTLSHAASGAVEYAAISAGDIPSVTVTIDEDDEAGVSVNPTALTVVEGSTASYTVVLDTQPSADVTVTISGHSGSDLNLSAETLTFTPDNWNVAQTVTVSAAQDEDAAADPTVTLSHAVNGTGEYAAVSAEDIPSVTVTIDEDDEAGVSVNPTALTVVEGSTASYTVVLDTQPSAEVTVTISGHTGSDLNLSAETLTFTSVNWNQAQTVRVSADQDADAAADPAVTLSHAVSGAVEYAAVSAEDIPGVTVAIEEDDAAGVSVDPTALTVVEGSTASYTVVLDTQPSAEVTVAVSGHDGTDVSVTPSTLTFTSGNWNQAQTVTVSADQDDDAAADPAVTLSHAVSGAVEYAAISAGDIPSVTVTIEEDDAAGVSVNPTALTVVEGSTASYTVVLDTQPSADVTVTVTGHAETDLSLSGQSLTNDELTFTPANWNVAKTVTVSAGQDDDAAADPAVTLSHAVSGASEYAAISAGDIPSVTVTIDEDDAARVSINPTVLTVVEGSTASYTVVLTTQPSADVTVTISGHSGSDVSVTPSTLTFTSDNWGTAQTVTVSAAQDEDAAADQAVILSHAVNGTGEYASVTAESVTVTITENDVAGVAIAPTSLTVIEGDATGASYTVVLDSQPTADVTVTISGHDGTDVSVTPSTLTFTSENWETPQTVTVSAAQDADAADDTQTVGHAVADGSAAEYIGATIDDVQVTVTDDDAASVSIDPTELTVTEGDATGDSYTVVLDSQPTADVTVTVSGHDGTDVSVAPSTLTFTSDNWGTAQTVTVSAAQDEDAAADQAVILSHAVNGTGEYASVTAESVTVTITENDAVGVAIAPTSLTVTEGDATGASYTVVLDSQPTADVTVTISGHDGTDVSVTPSTLTFTSENWETPQTVTVSAAQDADAADDTQTVGHAVADGSAAEYIGATIDDVQVTVTDDDAASVSIDPTELTVTEGDATGDSYTVVLDSQPTADVTVTVSGHDGTDVSVAPSTLTFTSDNWGTAQTVTVSAAQDEDAAADQAVILSHAVNGTGEYASVTAESVTVTITENDAVGVAIAPTSLTVTEGDATGASYTVVLDSQPTADVTVTISGHDGTDVSVTPSTLTFTSENWETPQTVTVSAAQDEDAAADQAVILSHAVNGTGEYASVTAESVTVTITENDAAGVAIAPTSLTVIEGDATGASYTVVLDSQPTADVTVTISGHSGTDVSLDTSTLTFTSENWETPQTVTVSAGDVETSTEVTLSHEVTGSGEYGTVTADDVIVSVLAISEENQDPDQVGVRVSFADKDYDVREGLDNADVELVLSDAPDSAIDIAIIVSSQSTAGGEDYSGAPTTVTFAQYQTSASFQVQPLVDLEDEDDEQLVLAFGTLPEGTSAGSVTQATVTIQDAVRVSFDAPSYEATEGGPDAIVTVQLNEPAPYDMNVALTAEGRNGADESDWSGVPGNVVFSTGDTSKSFTVIAVDDTVEDDDEMVELGFETLPGGLIAEDPATATLTIMNQEEAQPTEDNCNGAIWRAVVTFDNHHGSNHDYIYHAANTDSSIDKDHFTYNGTKYTVINIHIEVLPEALYYRPPFAVPGFSNLTISIGAGSHDWETASIWAVSLDLVADWTLYLDDLKLPFRGVELLDGIYSFNVVHPGGFHWYSAEFSTFDNTGTNGDGKYTMCTKANEITPVSDATDDAVTEGPKFVSGEVKDNIVKVTFDEALSANPTPSSRVLYVEYNEIHHEITDLEVSGNQLILTLDRPVGWGPEVWIHHIDMPVDPDPPIRDLAGNRAPFFIDKYLTNHTPSEAWWLEVSPGEAGQLHATWRAPFEDKGSAVTEYRIQWKKAADSWEGSDQYVLTVDDPDDPNIRGYTPYEHTIEALDGGVPYTVRVIAVHRAGEGPPSDEVTATPAHASLPGRADESGPDNNRATGVPGIAGTPFAGQTLTADTSGIEDEDGLTKVSFNYQWLFIDGTTTTEVPGATESTYTLSEDDEGKAIAVRVTFTDDAGNEEMLTSPAVLGMSVATPNTPATGAPTIGGTPQVGQTLTVDVAGIADEDGLDSVTFTYQWVRNDGNADGDIQDATDSSYTLTDADEGKTVKVKVSFTDNAGNEETRPSAPAGPVGAQADEEEQEDSSNDDPAQENTHATGAPTITGTARVGQTLTADTSGIADEDGLASVSYSYQWVADDTNIQGATDATYTLAEDDEGKTLTVEVSFTDDGGNEESLTSVATGEVAPEAGPGPLTGFTLVDTSGPYQEVLWEHWRDGSTLTLDYPASGSYGIRVDTKSGEEIGSVRLELSGLKTVDRTEGAAPYSLYGDEGEDELNGESLPVGDYILTATAYTQGNLQGEKLGTLMVSFTVAASEDPPPARPEGLTGEATAEWIELTWKAPAGSAITQYVVYRAELQNGQLNGQALTKYATIDATGAAMAYTDDNVEEGVEYRYRVAAVNSDGEGKKSTWLDITAEDPSS